MNSLRDILNSEDRKTLNHLTTILDEKFSDIGSSEDFPIRIIEELKSAGLMGFFIPSEYGGMEGSLPLFACVASAIGTYSMEAAIIWTMHCQQVATLVRHYLHETQEVVNDVAINGHLIASVVSEYGKGGELLTAISPLINNDDGNISFVREAPAVSYGNYAKYFLCTMKRSAKSKETDVVLVLFSRDQVNCDAVEQWDVMGASGTQSISMKFNGILPDTSVLGSTEFREVVMRTMAPVIHVGWSSAWFGVAQSVFSKFTSYVWNNKQFRKKLRSDMFSDELARARLDLDLVDSIIFTVVSKYGNFSECGSIQNSTNHNIMLNNLKVASSELTFKVVDRIMELGGLYLGYTRNSLGIEKGFRDLRSASIMFSNHRLLKTNSRLIEMVTAGIGN